MIEWMLGGLALAYFAAKAAPTPGSVPTPTISQSTTTMPLVVPDTSAVDANILAVSSAVATNQTAPSINNQGIINQAVNSAFVSQGQFNNQVSQSFQQLAPVQLSVNRDNKLQAWLVKNAFLTIVDGSWLNDSSMVYVFYVRSGSGTHGDPYTYGKCAVDLSLSVPTIALSGAGSRNYTADMPEYRSSI